MRTRGGRQDRPPGRCLPEDHACGPIPLLCNAGAEGLGGCYRPSLCKAGSTPFPIPVSPFPSTFFLYHCHQVKGLDLPPSPNNPVTGTHPPHWGYFSVALRASWRVLPWFWNTHEMLKNSQSGSSLFCKKQTAENKKKKHWLIHANCTFQRKPVSRFKWTMIGSHDTKMIQIWCCKGWHPGLKQPQVTGWLDWG